MLLWLLAFWLLAHGAIPGVLDMLGLEREELASHGQVTLAATHCRRPGRHPGRPPRSCNSLGRATRRQCPWLCVDQALVHLAVEVRKLAATPRTLWRCRVPIKA